jgi:hypothetical protein
MKNQDKETKKLNSLLRWRYSRSPKSDYGKIEDISPKRFSAFEPKTANRFLVETKDIPSILIKECGRPSFCMKDGAKSWNHISIRLYDAIYPSGSGSVMKKLQSGHKWNFNIKLLGPVGDVVEVWEVKNAEVLSVDFSELDCSKDEFATVRVLLKPETADLISPK